MIRILVSLVAICTAATPGPIIDDMSPCLSRPERGSAFYIDSCRRLCEEFSADRRGNGYDLCDSHFQSRCVTGRQVAIEYCDYLYWSVTEDGQPGIVYSLDGTDLPDAERGHPVRCTEAEEIVWPRRTINTVTATPLSTDEFIYRNSQ